MTADRAGCARAEGMREPPQGGRAPSLSPAVGRGGTDVSAFRRGRGVRTTRSIIASVSLSSPKAVPNSPGSISPMMASSPLVAIQRYGRRGAPSCEAHAMPGLVTEGNGGLHVSMLCDCSRGRQLSILLVGGRVYLGRYRVKRSGKPQSLNGLRRYTFTTC